MKPKKTAKTIGNVGFSPREFDVIACLLLGKTSRKSMASHLGISTTTVATYMSSIMKKLSCSSWEHVRIFAEKHGDVEAIRAHFQHPDLEIAGDSNTVSSSFINSLLAFYGRREGGGKYYLVFTLLLIICAAAYLSIHHIFFSEVKTTDEGVLRTYKLPPTVYTNASQKNLYELPQLTGENEEKAPEYYELKSIDDSLILNRNHYTRRISKRFAASKENSDSVPIVTLVGMGGSGKTTLARIWVKQYMQLNKMTFFWEINAETRETLRASFADLAEALSTSYAKKETLAKILSLLDEHAKYKALIRFVKKNLACQKEWILIFDNVENYAEIKAGLPKDIHHWGNGRVLITTRNAQFKYVDLIHPKNVLYIDELATKEQLELFQLTSRAYNDHFDEVNFKHLQELLKVVPPFPLDTVLVAKQIAQNNMTCEGYLLYLKSKGEKRPFVLSSLPKSINDYSKTRYEIVTKALENILSKNSCFSDLIVLIGLIESQNIPVNLLKASYTTGEVEEFISELQKESLITLSSNQNKIETFSVHRSVHENITVFAKQKFKRKPYQEKLHRIARLLEDHLHQTTNNADTNTIKIMLSHMQRFFTNVEFQELKLYESLMAEFAILNFFVGNYQKSYEILRQVSESKYFRKLPELKQARVLVFLGISTRELIGYSEAIEFLKKGISLYNNNTKANPVEVCRAISFLGYVYRNLGDFNKARQLLEKALSDYDSKSINLPSLEIEIYSNLANVYKDLGEYEKALDLFYVCLEKEKSNPHIDMNNYVSLFVYLGDIYLKVENYTKAEKLLTHSHQLYKQYFSEKHIDFAWSNIHLGLLYNRMGKYELALKHLQEAKPLYQRLLSKDHVAIGILSHCIGDSYIGLRRYREAKAYLYQSLNVYKKKYGSKSSLRVARLLHSFGKLYIKENNVSKGYDYLQAALSIYQDLHHPEQYLVLEELGNLFAEYPLNVQFNDFASLFRSQARIYYLKALSVFEKKYSATYLVPYSRLERKLSSPILESKKY